MDLPAPATVRLFLALWPSSGLRAALLEGAEAWTWPAGARPTRPESLHVTLHFLGSVASSLVPALQRGLFVPWEGCELVLDRPQVWPGGIAVLEAGTLPPALCELHARLGERLHALGVATETRPWRPHFTLARKAAGARPPTEAPPLRWRTGAQYLLVRSVPGAGYQPLQCFG